MRRVHVFAVAAALISVTFPVSAQQYPSKPVRMVIGFPPGGGTDIVGRIVAQKLSDTFGQQVLPDNRGGAGGQIGTEMVARSQPDGYTVLMAHVAALSILPSLIPKLPYDPTKDFAPVTLVAIAPNLLVVHRGLYAVTVKSLIQLARARPGQLRFASPGAGTVQHLAGELFKLQAKVDMLHVPYKGSGQSTVDLLAGHVQLNFDSVPAVIAHVKSGKLVALAVTSPRRFALLPDIPSLSEAGLKGFDMSTWWGLVFPAGVNKEIVAKLHDSTVGVLKQPDVRESMARAGAEIVGNTPDEFAAFIRNERVKYAKVIKDANIKLE